MGIVRGTLIGAIFPIMAPRKLQFLERDWNWKVVRRGLGAIDYALKNSVLAVSYNRIGFGLLYTALYHVPPAEQSGGTPEGENEPGFRLGIIAGALAGTYPPRKLTWTSNNLQELDKHLEALAQALQIEARPILMGEEIFDQLEGYRKRVDGDYFKNYILETVEPHLATEWASKSNEEISELYGEWCDYYFGRKKRPSNQDPS